MMMKLRNALVIGLFFAFAAPAAQAHYVSLLGAGTFTMPTSSNVASPTFGNGIGFGGGARVGLNLAPAVALELGGFYVQRKHDETVGVNTNTLTNWQLQVPLDVRFSFARYFSIAVGGYANLAASDYTNQSGTTVNYASLGFKAIDYGIQGGLQAAIPFSPMVALTLEGNYEYQLSNSVVDPTGVSTASVKFNQIQGLVGLRFGSAGVSR